MGDIMVETRFTYERLRAAGYTDAQAKEALADQAIWNANARENNYPEVQRNRDVKVSEEYQQFLHKTPTRKPNSVVKPVDVDWYRTEDKSGCPFDLMQSAIDEYNIRSKWTTTASGSGVYLIQSNNIFLQVPILSMKEAVRGSPAELNGWTDNPNLKGRLGIWGWRTKKADDDKLAYGMSVEAMYAKSKRNGYFMSEQHAVWAMGASARTGCHVPPEFFAEVEVNGGTAGNGPDVLPAGNIGEPMSTIAMAHDADWLIGRLFGQGPLGNLVSFGEEQGHRHKNLSKSSLKAMGSAGLFDAPFIGSLAVAPANDTTGAQQAVRRRLDDFLDNPHVKHRYRAPDSIFLNQDATDWRVKYSKNWSRFFAADAARALIAGFISWAGFPWSAATVDAIIASRVDNYIFHQKDPRVGNATDVRNNNRGRNGAERKTPYFPKTADKDK